MHPTIEATETSTPTADRAVRDFDELDDRAQTALSEAANDGAIRISEGAAESFTHGEVVRFTGYYRVSIGQ